MSKWKHIRISAGQSIVFMAILLLVLIAFAGLSIDTGRAFQQQRTIQAGANGGAVAGMNQVVLQARDSEVRNAVLTGLINNNVKTPTQVNNNADWGTNVDTVYFKAVYLDSAGQFLQDVGSYGSSITPINLPEPAAYVRVITHEPVSTTFAKVVGRDRFNVSAQGVSGITPCKTGVMPLTFHIDELQKTDNPTVAGASELVQALPAPFWELEEAQIKAFYPKTIFTVYGDDTKYPNKGNFLFLQWLVKSTGPALEEGWTGTGTLSDGFEEAPPPLNVPDKAGYDLSVSLMNNQLEKYDWLSVKPGNNVSLKDNYDWHILNKSKIILPLHDLITEESGGRNFKYRVSQMVRVRLLGYKQTPVNAAYYRFALLQTTAFCSGLDEVPPPPADLTFNAYVDEHRIWADDKDNSATPYDITLVVDISASSKWCWDTNDATSCGPKQRRIDYVKDFVGNFVTAVYGASDKHRVAMVFFGDADGDLSTAKVVVNYKNSGTDNGKVNDFTQPIQTLNNTNMDGNTSTAHGLNKAYDLIASRPDKTNQPLVLLITDGLTNVFWGINDGKLNDGTINNNGVCLTPGVDIINHPLTQATCPNPLTQKSYGTPPIQSAITQAENSRTYDPTLRTYAIVISEPGGLTPEDRYLDEIAARTFWAKSSSELVNSMPGLMLGEITDSCEDQIDAPIWAEGATVTITAPGKTTVTTTVAANGFFTAQLEPGEYQIRVNHSNQVSIYDPQSIARNYTKLKQFGSATPASSVTVVMPSHQPTYYYNTPENPLGLYIDDPTWSVAQTCP